VISIGRSGESIGYWASAIGLLAIGLIGDWAIGDRAIGLLVIGYRAIGWIGRSVDRMNR
jgi:hypothetical protein